MAQSSVAREPTMEEILASIRRIIESNDEAGPRRPEPRPKLASIDGAVTGDAPVMAVSDRQDDDAAAGAPAAANDIDDAMRLTGLGDVLRADESMDELARDLDADDAEMAKASSAVQPLAGIRPGSLQPAISLADVAAKLRGREEPSRGETAIASKQVEAPAVDADESDYAPALEAEADRAQPAEAAAKAQAAEPSEITASDSEPVSQEDGWESAMPGERKAESATEDASEDAGLSAPADAPVAQAAEKQAAALVSTETSTKVAAAFGELNEAIERGKMRSFEEIAEEMLRPMLAEWLDDNLPTLVERLVREEIERVAQGGRR